jgi:sec-independent protein translocase protein TatA
MGTFSIWHILIIGALVLVVFGGGGKISSLLGDAGRGMKAFKDGLKETVIIKKRAVRTARFFIGRSEEA